MHKRKEIKAKLVELLKTAVPELQNRIYSNQIRKIRDSKFPFANIRSDGEESEILDTAPRTYGKDFSYTVEIFTEDDELEESLDLISEKVESVLTANETLDGLVVDTILKSIDYNFDYEARNAVSVCTISFTSSYEMQVVYAELQDEFGSSHTEYDLGEDSENVIDDLDLTEEELP